MGVRACVRACVRASVCACMRASVCACVRACMDAFQNCINKEYGRNIQVDHDWLI